MKYEKKTVSALRKMRVERWNFIISSDMYAYESLKMIFHLQSWTFLQLCIFVLFRVTNEPHTQPNASLYLLFPNHIHTV